MNCGWFWNFITDSVIPVFIAVGSVYCAEHFARKRDYKQKNIEIQIDYMRKEINYLAEMEYDMMLVPGKWIVLWVSIKLRIEKINTMKLSGKLAI